MLDYENIIPVRSSSRALFVCNEHLGGEGKTVTPKLSEL